MKNFWQVLRGILIALASVGLLFGGLSLSLAEGNMKPAQAVTPSSTLSASPQKSSPTFTLRPSNTPTPSFSPTEGVSTDTPIPPTQTETFPPTPTNCPPPGGWVPYTVKPGDTLALLATRYRVSVASLKSGNCLTVSDITPGSILYVPPAPTHTPIPCGPPSGWVLTYVLPGDTLYRLSLAYGVSVAQLQSANCMGASTLLRVGQTLYVPPWATRVPTFTPAFGDTPTYVPTNTLAEPTNTNTVPVFYWTDTETPPENTPTP